MSLKRTQLEQEHGMNFILNSLRGGHPDKYYFENRKYIDAFLKQLRFYFRPSPQKVYRGILLNPQDVPDLKLKPLDYMSFLSFSEDKSIAHVFADMESDMAMPYRYINPEHEGFLIEYTVQPDEIMFHHSWADTLGIERFFGDDIKIVHAQKEVMIKNSPKVFDLVPVQRGVSNGQTHGVSYDSHSELQKILALGKNSGIGIITF